jgi:NTP pyrophosphatase (non-canonical NTP hydrolase)
MNADTFQVGTKTTMAYPGDVGLPYLTMGLAGEAGEVANKVKKILRDGRQEPNKAEVNAIIDEIGDVLWYCAQLSGFLGVPLSQVMRRNQEKLLARKALGLLTQRGTNE